MDGLDGLDLALLDSGALLDSSASDALGVLSFNNADDFSAVMSLFSGLDSGNLSFDDFTNDSFWDTNDSFGGFDDFLYDFFGWDGDDEPPEPDPDPDDEPPGPGDDQPFDEIISTGTIIPQWQPNYDFNFGAYFAGALDGLFDIAPLDLTFPDIEFDINCGTITIGGIEIEVVITSSTDPNIRLQNMQLVSALNALSQAFAQNASGSISAPGFGNLSYGGLFDGVSSSPINLIVDDTLSDFSNNTDSPITVTTAAGHQIIVQPNGIIRGYTDFTPGGGADIYIDVNTGVLDAGGSFTNLMETIIHELLHALNPNVSETQVEQAAQDIINDLQTNGGLSGTPPLPGNICPSGAT